MKQSTRSKVRSAVFAGLQRASRTLRPFLAGTGALGVARRLVGGKWTPLRDAASQILDPPGVSGTVRVAFDGGWMTVPAGESIGRYLAYDFPFESFEAKLFAGLLREGDVVFDVGANIGLYSLLAARRIATGVLHAFEPNPRVFGILEQNLSSVGPGRNIHLHQVAISDSPGTARLLCAEDSAYSSVIATGRSAVATEVDVPRTTIDDFVAQTGVAQIDLMKIDVEGLEPEVVAGARRLLSLDDAPILLIEIAEANLAPRGLTQLDVVRTLEALRYDVRSAAPGLPHARALDRTDRNLPQENFLAFKPARADRLRTLGIER